MKASLFKRVVFTGLLSLVVMGFAEDQFIELKEHVYARSSALFSGARHDNKIGILPPGTRGQITEKVTLPSGNHGFRIRILNGPRQGQQVWVYYNLKKPTLSLYSAEQQKSPVAKVEDADTAVTNENVPALPEIVSQAAVPGATRVCLSDNRSLLTHYNSDPRTYRSHAEAKMEGGAETRYSGPRNREFLNSVEEAIQNGRPISLASDIHGDFGARCNRINSRCTLLVHSRGFDKRYPNYKLKFPGLPEDTFVGIVEDTGNHFLHKGTSKIDLAVRDRGISSQVSDKNMQFTEIANPCGKTKAARHCNLSGLRLVDQCDVARNRVAPDAEVVEVTNTSESTSLIR